MIGRFSAWATLLSSESNKNNIEFWFDLFTYFSLSPNHCKRNLNVKIQCRGNINVKIQCQTFLRNKYFRRNAGYFKILIKLEIKVKFLVRLIKLTFGLIPVIFRNPQLNTNIYIYTIKIFLERISYWKVIS